MIALAAVFLLAPALAAQELPAGTWTGSITQPDGSSYDVGYEVSDDDGALAISLVPPRDSGADDQRLPFEDVRISSESLSFTMNMGMEIKCILEPTPGGAWAGTCTDDGGLEGQMVMVPPAGE